MRFIFLMVCLVQTCTIAAQNLSFEEWSMDTEFVYPTGWEHNINGLYERFERSEDMVTDGEYSLKCIPNPGVTAWNNCNSFLSIPLDMTFPVAQGSHLLFDYHAQTLNSENTVFLLLTVQFYKDGEWVDQQQFTTTEPTNSFMTESLKLDKVEADSIHIRIFASQKNGRDDGCTHQSEIYLDHLRVEIVSNITEPTLPSPTLEQVDDTWRIQNCAECSTYIIVDNLGKTLDAGDITDSMAIPQRCVPLIIVVMDKSGNRIHSRKMLFW